MLDNLPADVRTVIYVALSILAFLFLLIIIKYTFTISTKILNKKSLKPKKNRFIFGPVTYWQIKNRYGLKFSEMKFLKRILGAIKIPSAKVLLINPEMAYFYFKQYLDYIFNSALKKREKEHLTDKTLNLCPHFIKKSEVLKTTKLIPINIQIKIRNEFGGSFFTKIVDVNSRHILIAVPQKMEKHIETLQDMILTVDFTITDDAGYEFTTFVTGTKQIGSTMFFMLAHSDKLERKQRRQFYRRECKIPVSFYLLSLYKFEGREKVMLHKKTMTAGYITNICSQGIKILAKNQEAFETKRLIKVEYKINGKKENVIGKIKNVKTIHNETQKILHVEIVKQAQSSMRNNSLFAFNIHPFYDNNTPLKQDMPQKSKSEKMLEKLRNNTIALTPKIKPAYAKVKMHKGDLKRNKPSLIKKVKM